MESPSLLRLMAGHRSPSPEPTVKPNARASAFWGASFALLAAALAVAMVMILRSIAAELPATPPHTTFEYQIAFRPFLAPLLNIYALDQMFVVAYGAAFVAAAVSWARPVALAGVAVIAGLATAGIDTMENLRSIAVLAALPDGPPAAADLDALDFLGAIKWIAAGVTSVALSALVPRRGALLAILAALFALDGAASLALGVARLKLVDALTAVEPALANGVIFAMPVGLLLLGVALLAEARHKT